MDFSIDGSDSWSTTPFQENFIKSYFSNQKTPATITDERKNVESLTIKKDSKGSKKKKKKSKVEIESFNIASTSDAKESDIGSQSSKKQHNVGISKQNLGKQKKKRMKCNSEKDTITLSESHFEFEEKIQEDLDRNFHLEQNKSSSKKIRKSIGKLITANETKKRKKHSVQLQDCADTDSSTEDICLENTKNVSRNAKKVKSLKNIGGPSSSDIITGNFAVHNKKKKQKPKDTNENSISLIDDDEDDEALREELKSSNILKRISKLFEKAPYLNPNFKGKVIDDDEDTNEDDNAGSNDAENSIEDDNSGSNGCEDSSEGDNAGSNDDDDSIEDDNADSNDDSIEDDNAGLNSNEMEDDSNEDDNNVSSQQNNTDTSEHDNTDASEDNLITESEDDVNDNPMDSFDEEDDLEIDEISNDDEENASDFSLGASSEESTEIKAKQSALPKKKSSKDLLTKTQEKLGAAKFRFLNEKLYTESGYSAFKYFRENPEEFHDYHKGYSLQVSKWPMNPVDKIIADLKELKKGTVIADLGCGNAKIARSLSKYKVHSFDLVSLNSHVTACNISKIPLSKESVNVVVFCLSLMGTNLKDYLLEAHRVLKLGGILKIAEVESRIDSLDKFIKSFGAMGFRMTMKDEKHKIFVFLDFIKETNDIKVGKGSGISLKPCLYKKR